MYAFTRKYSDHIIVILVSIILALLLIIFTDIRVSRINRQMQETIHVTENKTLETYAIPNSTSSVS